MVAGLTAGTTFGEGKEIKEQVEATGGLPKDKYITQATSQTKLCHKWMCLLEHKDLVSQLLQD